MAQRLQLGPSPSPKNLMPDPLNLESLAADMALAYRLPYATCLDLVSLVWDGQERATYKLRGMMKWSKAKQSRAVVLGMRDYLSAHPEEKILIDMDFMESMVEEMGNKFSDGFLAALGDMGYSRETDEPVHINFQDREECGCSLEHTEGGNEPIAHICNMHGFHDMRPNVTLYIVLPRGGKQVELVCRKAPKPL